MGLGKIKLTLDVVCVLAHPLGFIQLASDDEFASVELLPDVVQVDQPVLALEGQQLRGLPRTCPAPKIQSKPCKVTGSRGILITFKFYRQTL